MKKSLILGIIGLAGSVASSYAQGFILLDNYSTYGPYITYGANSGGSGGILGEVTVGIYFGQGTFSAAADPSGTADPTSLNALFGVGSGPGSTALGNAGGTAGAYLAGATFAGNTVAGNTSTFMVVAWKGAASYAAATIRGHSDAFQLVCKVGSDPSPNITASGQNAFSIYGPTIPEPSTLALAGLGLASMLVARRRK